MNYLLSGDWDEVREVKRNSDPAARLSSGFESVQRANELNPEVRHARDAAKKTKDS